MKNILICTVGTSLFESNLKRLPENAEKFPNTVPQNWKELFEAYQSSNWKVLAKELLKVDPTQRVCGAEINAIEETCQKKWLSLEKLYFLVSDTPYGIHTGTVLTEYFKQRSDLKLKKDNVAYKKIDRLQDKVPKDFKTHGLRNLVRAIGEYLQRMGGTENVAIDATGGYKAQIAIAVVIGQALNIPVYYKHERFSEIIDFPPMPVTLDYDILAEHADILTDFERGEAFSAGELGEVSERLRVFLNEIDIDGEPYYELNAIGQVYLTGFRLRYQQRIELAKVENRKSPTFRDDHYPKGFKDFVNKVWQENHWITTAHSVPYSGQAAIKDIGFKVMPQGEERHLIGTFQDENQFGAKFRIRMPDESATKLAMAADRLNQKYRGS